MNFYADQIGRHMLYFVVNNQPSNVVVVDVFSQSQLGTGKGGIVPISGHNQPIVLGGKVQNYYRSTNGLTSTTSNGLTTTTSNGHTTTITSNGQTTTTSE